MDKHPATDRNGFSRLSPQPIALTPAETNQVAGGVSPYPVHYIPGGWHGTGLPPGAVDYWYNDLFGNLV